MLLAAVIFYNVSGHFLYFLVQQHVIRASVAEMIHHHEAPLEMLLISEDEAAVLMAEEDDEIFYHNELYDITLVEHSGSSLKIFCYKDVNEKNLLHQLGAHSKNNNATRHKGKNLKLQNAGFSDVIFACVDKLFYEQNTFSKCSDLFLRTGQFIPGLQTRPPEQC